MDKSNYGILALAVFAVVIGLIGTSLPNEITPVEIGKGALGETNFAGAATSWQWYVIGCTAMCAIPDCNSRTYSRTAIRNDPRCDADYDWGVTCRKLITDTDYNIAWRDFSNYDCECLSYPNNLAMIDESNAICAEEQVKDRCYYGSNLTNSISCGYGTKENIKSKYCGFCKSP